MQYWQRYMELNPIALEEYATAARDAGCPADQVRAFVSAGYYAIPQMLPFHALARQIDQHNGVDEVLLDGTRGSAKSHAVIAQIGIDDCQRAPGIKCLFLRQTLKAAGESFDDLISRVLRNVRHKKNTERVVFPNGSRILIGGYQNDNDIDKYLGIEYDIIAPEEGTQISGEKLEKLRGSLRTSRSDWVPRMYLTTNPGGIGHSYFKQHFIDPNRAGKEISTRRFFTSFKDNPFINPEYKAYLEALTGTLAKQWRDGDWDIFEGMAFSQWDRSRHVVRPFEIPNHWIRITGTDWGYAAPFATVWGAKNPDNNRIVIYRGIHEQGLTDPQQAKLILSSEAPGEKIRQRYADPSMWAKKTQTDLATSTADVYRECGVMLTQAVNDRIAGKRKVDRLLADLPDGQPGLIVFESVYDLPRTLPSLIYDKTQPEDVDSSGDDHDYDALRYLLTDDKTISPPRYRAPNQWTGRNTL
jgi:phage terminase large subunit